MKTSAPGKLMLLGEHAVMYGYPCLVSAVDKRVYVNAELIDGAIDIIEAPQAKNPRFVKEVIRYLKAKYHLKSAVKVSTNGDISNGIGLGSSSAVTVATCAVLSEVWNLSLSSRDIFDISYKVILSIQRVGSGFDIAAATFGGTLFYVKGGDTVQKLSVGSLPIVVGYSKEKANTAKIVQAVASRYKNDQKRMDRIFEQISKLVNEGKQSLLAKNMEQFGQLMTQNHFLLKELGVSTIKLDEMVSASLDAGAHGAKLSGAGGGDIMIALVPEEKMDAVKRAIKQAGGEIIEVQTGVDGIKTS